MREMNIALGDLDGRIAQFQADGKTAVVVTSDNKVAGVIAMQDQLRPEAYRVIEQLHRFGIRTVMLTGDNRATGESVARRLGNR